MTNRHITVRNRSGTVSFLWEKRAIVILLSLVAITSVCFIAGLSIGSTMISPVAVVKYLLGADDGEHQFIIGTHRLPRMILSLLVGAALGLSGLLLQGIVRNPLASPDIIGITGGASVAAIAYIAYFSETAGIKWLPFASILGAAIVSTAIYALSWNRGVTPYRLVLIGMGMAAATGALTMMMIVLSNTDVAAKAYIWMTGSVYGATWGQVYAMLSWLVVFVPLALLLNRVVNVQELGDDVAAGLGARVQWQRLGMIGISVALAGAAVAFAGAIGFVGLMAPHMARKLAGRSYAVLVPVTAIIGGLLVCSADVVARTAFLPLDIPAGVFTAGIGAPFFIYLLFRSRKPSR